MRAVPIRWEDLETAFERNAPDTESWLDLRSGGVVTIIDGEPDAPIKRGEVSASPTDFLRIDAASSREQYRWMEHFVASVTEPALRERLVISIDGKGAFRRFKNVLLSYPVERERWFSYRSELLRYQMQEWLTEKGISATVPPPWGRVEAPKELEEPLVRPVAATGEAPGEALRRQARELIDSIPAIDLPTAITFLEFIRERGAEEIRPPRNKKDDDKEEAAARPPDKPPVSLVGGTRS
ncbi:MAG: hypothetical protein IT370_36550 [Deltaproteobacteria bacterium]|nr:hypothetical protein [Deltaproteobacteria bacterium]